MIFRTQLEAESESESSPERTVGDAEAAEAQAQLGCGTIATTNCDEAAVTVGVNRGAGAICCTHRRNRSLGKTYPFLISELATLKLQASYHELPASPAPPDDA
jgi:hypothetical protein